MSGGATNGHSPYRMNYQTAHSPAKMLSMDSSTEMGDDPFALPGNSSYSSNKLNMSFSSMNTTRTSQQISDDEVFANATQDVGERLSHSAARHKMAIRPKKNVGRRGRLSEGVSSETYAIYH